MRVHLVTANIAAAFAAASLAACSHAEVKPDTSEAKKEEVKPAEQKTADKTDEQKAAEYKAEGQAQLDQAMKRLDEVSVFFEFDESTLTKEATARLGDVASVLVKHPELKIKIEGNTDERGTADYNLALGQRRADSTKKYLESLGVASAQVEKTISYGAEKPKAQGHNEEAWKENRRSDVRSADSN